MEQNHNPLFPQIYAESEKAEPQDRQVLDCMVELCGLPDEVYGVKVLDGEGRELYEVKDDRDLAEDEFRVDYTHGYAYFHPKKNKQIVKIQEYYSRGLLWYPASRIYAMDENGYVDLEHNLQVYIDSLRPFLYRGEYDPAMTYRKNNFVYYNGSFYIAETDVDRSTPPTAENAQHWKCVAAGFCFRGTYSAAAQYEERDAVTNGKTLYLCRRAGKGMALTNTAYWTCLLSVQELHDEWNHVLKPELFSLSSALTQAEAARAAAEAARNETFDEYITELNEITKNPIWDTKADKEALDGGFAGGRRAATLNGGAAIGLNADCNAGGAVGSGARVSNYGGAVGLNTWAGAGFSGGANAKAAAQEGFTTRYIDAVQLGTGTNSAPKTLQVYAYQLLDALGKIPAERLNGMLIQDLGYLDLDTNYYTVLDSLTQTGIYRFKSGTVYQASSGFFIVANGNDYSTEGDIVQFELSSAGMAYRSIPYPYDSTVEWTYFNKFVADDQRNKPRGYAGLDAYGKVPSALLSGVVKTVNGTAPDAAGNIVVSGGETVALVNNLTMAAAGQGALDAAQGKALDEKKADKTALSAHTGSTGNAAAAGHVKLTNTLTQTAAGTALDAAQGKILSDKKADKGFGTPYFTGSWGTYTVSGTAKNTFSISGTFTLADGFTIRIRPTGQSPAAPHILKSGSIYPILTEDGGVPAAGAITGVTAMVYDGGNFICAGRRSNAAGLRLGADVRLCGLPVAYPNEDCVSVCSITANSSRGTFRDFQVFERELYVIFMRASSNNYNFEGLLGLFKDDGTKASQNLYISGSGLRAGIFHDFTIDRAHNFLYISWENQSDYNNKGPNITKIALDPETGLPAVPDDEGTVIDAEGVLSTILVSGTGRLYGRYEDRETKKFCYWDGAWHNNMTTDVLGGVLAAHPTMDYIYSLSGSTLYRLRGTTATVFAVTNYEAGKLAWRNGYLYSGKYKYDYLCNYIGVDDSVANGVFPDRYGNYRAGSNVLDRDGNKIISGMTPQPGYSFVSMVGYDGGPDGLAAYRPASDSSQDFIRVYKTYLEMEDNS